MRDIESLPVEIKEVATRATKDGLRCNVTLDLLMGITAAKDVLKIPTFEPQGEIDPDSPRITSVKLAGSGRPAYALLYDADSGRKLWEGRFDLGSMKLESSSSSRVPIRGEVMGEHVGRITEILVEQVDRAMQICLDMTWAQLELPLGDYDASAGAFGLSRFFSAFRIRTDEVERAKIGSDIMRAAEAILVPPSDSIATIAFSHGKGDKKVEARLRIGQALADQGVTEHLEAIAECDPAEVSCTITVPGAPAVRCSVPVLQAALQTIRRLRARDQYDAWIERKEAAEKKRSAIPEKEGRLLQLPLSGRAGTETADDGKISCTACGKRAEGTLAQPPSNWRVTLDTDEVLCPACAKANDAALARAEARAVAKAGHEPEQPAANPTPAPEPKRVPGGRGKKS